MHVSRSNATHTLGRHGSVTIYAVVALVALCGVCSLAVDWGRVQLAKTEMQRAVDAAARAAVASLPDTTAARSQVSTVMGYNTVDGQTLSVAAADIRIGKWDSTTQTLDTSSINPDAVQVIARRTAASGNAVPLVFAKIVGLTGCDVTCSATALKINGQPSGITGLSYIAMRKGFFGASYNSAVTTTPSHTSYYSNGVFSSNGVVGSGASSVVANNIYGSATLGPSGSVNSNVSVSAGSTTTATITGPAVTMTVVTTNPGGVGQTVGGSSSTSTLPGGTYYFTDVNCGSDVSVTFTGPATLYVNGNFALGSRCSLNPYQGIPSNLKVYQASGYSFSVYDNCNLCMQYIGTGCNFSSQDSLNFEGSIMAQTVTFRDYCSVYCDEALASSATISLVK